MERKRRREGPVNWLSKTFSSYIGTLSSCSVPTEVTFLMCVCVCVCVDMLACMREGVYLCMCVHETRSTVFICN